MPKEKSNLVFTEQSTTTAIPIMNVTPSPTVEIICEHGENVVIDATGDEVVVTGASEEGAKMFFVQILKPMIDDYIKEKNAGSV